MDQVTEQRLNQPADSREELVIDQRQGNQAPAPTQLLTSQHLGQTPVTSIGDSDSQRNIGENSEEALRHKKRVNDKNYRQRKKNKNEELKHENEQLKQEKDEQKQRINSLLEENEKLKWKLEEKERLCNSLLDRIAGTNEQSMSATCMRQLLAGFKLDFSSLSKKVDGLQQNITQLSGTQVYPHPSQPQLISQDSQAAATTLPLTQPSGISRMQQTLQSPGSFAEDSHGLSDFWEQQQSGQTSHPNNVLPQFSLPQEQGGNSAFVPLRFTDRQSDPYGVFDDEDESFYPGINLCVTWAPQFCLAFDSSVTMAEEPETEESLGRNHARSTEQITLEAFEAEHTRLKWEIEGTEQLIKRYLEVFAAEIEMLMREIEKKEQIMKNNREAFEAENGQLKYEIEEKETLMKSNMEAFEVKNRKLKIEIGEKEQPMKSMESFEAENGRLKSEIQAKEQLMKSNLQTLEAKIRQLVDELKSLNVANVAVNLRMQTHQGKWQKRNCASCSPM